MKFFIINNLKINYIPNNRSIIDYCENLGIDLPHYCYHPKLSIAGNCRMCLVEVKGSAKPVISCAMSILNKMEIYTDSPLVKKSREGILEFLLLNHPLDCPICDQGGECDLQDQSFVFGINKRRFYNYKRIVIDKNIGPIVKTVMTRCIHCTRCVRFSSEIAGSNELGMFGRGQSSEIGTYVKKIFNSELSGNVIDICPVGALTSKQYPFISRVWELKTINSIDYSDSSAINTQLYLKSNSIIKILPGYDTKNNNWISDKTRFSFDGMFSPERVSDIFTSEMNNNQKIYKSWTKIFDDIISILYFHNHLSKHQLLFFNILIIFNYNIDIDSLIMLNILEKKYPFVILRKSDEKTIDNDLELKYMFNYNNYGNSLEKSDFCLLINTNPRYENTNLNINLKSRFSKGNFNIFSLNSLVDLTYPSLSIGSNIKNLKLIVEGNHFICQDIINSKYPVFFLGSELSIRKDSKNILEMLFYFKNCDNIFNKKWNGYNYVTSSLNEVGVNSFNNFKNVSSKDLEYSSSIYFIDKDFSESNIKKLIELKLLNYFYLKNNNMFLLEIHNIFKGKFLNLLKSNFNSSTYVSLPNKVFFEDRIVLQNNLGSFKKSIKILNTTSKAKTNWQIIRKLISHLNHINENKIIHYEFNNYYNLKKYISFNYFPVISFNLSFHENSFSRNLYFPPEKHKNIKFYNTKTKLWLDDFYIGGKDLYTKFSLVMIECSKSFRLESTNFNFII